MAKMTEVRGVGEGAKNLATEISGAQHGGRGRQPVEVGAWCVLSKRRQSHQLGAPGEVRRAGRRRFPWAGGVKGRRGQSRAQAVANAVISLLTPLRPIFEPYPPDFCWPKRA